MTLTPRAGLLAGGVAIAVIMAGLVYGWRARAIGSGTFDALELYTLDLRFKIRGPEKVGDEVALVAFDDKTLEQRPELFERRAGMAEVIGAMRDAGAKVIGLDLVFESREHLLPHPLVADVDAWLDQPENAEASGRPLISRVHDEVHGDDALAVAIKDAGDVVLGMHVGNRGSTPDKGLAKGKYGQVSPGRWMPDSGDRVIVSDPLFVKGAARLGVLSVFEDATGAVRDVPLGFGLGQSVMVPFAVALVAEYRDVNRANVAYVGEDGSVHIGDDVIPGDETRLRLDWKGPSRVGGGDRDTFATYSVVDLVEGRLPADALRGKIAILGFTHLAEDTVDSPFGRQSGFTTHATAVDQILRHEWIWRATPARDALITLLAGLAATALFVPRKAAPGVQVAGAAAIVVASAVLTQVAFFSHVWISAIGPVFATAFASAFGLAGGYLQEGLQRRHLRKTFAHYLSDELVEELVADPSKVSLVGERRELTVLFTDIRNFTTFSERIPAMELADFLKAYFGPMTGVVLANSGYVDKFIGDAVMAIFGAPVRRGDHAANGCRTAIAMHAELEKIRPIADKLGIELAIGAGVNTGEMVVGNLGSAERFDYTVLGDAVNLGSRLEGLTKTYGVFCLVGPLTAAEAGPAFRFRPVDLVRVKGKLEPIELFELYSGPNGTIVAYKGVEVFAQGLAAWRAGELGPAKRSFDAFLVENPGDPVAKMYLERIAELGGAVPNGWDGVFTHTKK